MSNEEQKRKEDRSDLIEAGIEVVGEILGSIG